MNDTWVEPEAEWTQEEWEAARRDVDVTMDEHFGSGWRTWSQDEVEQALQQLLAAGIEPSVEVSGP